MEEKMNLIILFILLLFFYGILFFSCHEDYILAISRIKIKNWDFDFELLFKEIIYI